MIEFNNTLVHNGLTVEDLQKDHAYMDDLGDIYICRRQDNIAAYCITGGF